MKKVVAENHEIKIVEDDKPEVQPNYLLIKTEVSAISPGTEMTALNTSESRSLTLGYSAMGTVEACGEDIEGFKEGDQVSCYGAPYVKHAQYLLVPKTLCSKVPSSVTSEEAALGGIGAIAIHALRTAKLQFGETVAIVGLGLLGQMIARIAHAASYQVVACDLDEKRVNMVRKEGIQAHLSTDDLYKDVLSMTEDHGADAVLLCTGGKKSPLTHESLNWIRDRGKVVIVGDVEPDFPRNLMFVKEAELLISRAGGPGRYDASFEKDAVDYPYGFVRWTEGRNVSEYLRLVAEKRINVQPFLEGQVTVDNAADAYQRLNDHSDVLTYLIKH
ncbi:zinc-dependent alcohol dehydrogenase [Aquisalibacillus elongatus]|uniref:D-arabinose 1-dehydrogenase-like Zn-dependent alcohol dehydrogenase n=1 Tax=Aquisalibacillus elongatus TaxID=485577 RepID=A0A3N5BG87_9BACI|nr:zinc-binding alcohol dehydrogenase [Aquisalibacillus elongatus]RPF54280.1 D-arabinose 1-dehydrogenase-like Zn-dependent alcohol dehydrogenase [Aquisalibacillus elongatus]